MTFESLVAPEAQRGRGGRLMRPLPERGVVCCKQEDDQRVRDSDPFDEDSELRIRFNGRLGLFGSKGLRRPRLAERSETGVSAGGRTREGRAHAVVVPDAVLPSSFRKEGGGEGNAVLSERTRVAQLLVLFELVAAWREMNRMPMMRQRVRARAGRLACASATPAEIEAVKARAHEFATPLVP